MTKNNIIQLKLFENSEYLRFSNEIAVASITQNKQHVLFFDFDINWHHARKIIADLSYLQYRYSLSDIYVLYSRNGFNAICLDKFNINETYNILSKSKIIDKKYNDISFKRKNWFLRLGNDKKFFGVLYSEHDNKREKSNAHRILLNMLYHRNIRKTKYFDGYTILQFDRYKRAENEIEDTL